MRCDTTECGVARPSSYARKRRVAWPVEETPSARAAVTCKHVLQHNESPYRRCFRRQNDNFALNLIMKKNARLFPSIEQGNELRQLSGTTCRRWLALRSYCVLLPHDFIEEFISTQKESLSMLVHYDNLTNLQTAYFLAYKFIYK